MYMRVYALLSSEHEIITQIRRENVESALGNDFQDVVDAMQRDADMDMTMDAMRALVTFPPRSPTGKVNPFIVGNNLNAFISDMPRCCQFSMGMTLGLTSPEITLRTPNLLSIMRQANTSWTRADFVTDLMALDFNESCNSDIYAFYGSIPYTRTFQHQFIMGRYTILRLQEESVISFCVRVKKKN